MICDLCFSQSRPYQTCPYESRKMTPDATINCEGLLCPLPVLKARKRLLQMAEGTVLCVRATDPMAAIDMPHFCDQAGHKILQSTQDGAVQVYLIQRGADKS
jgi:tRNA 2-thiouridine synthesizing protein A